MTHIGFYKIAGDAQAALRFACQLTEKAFKQQMTVLIHTVGETQSEQLSHLLWSFSPVSFLPHGLEASPISGIAISHENEPGDHHGFLINLTNRVPGWFSRFERAAEIVYDEHQVIENKREHFKFYKDRGYPIQYHDLGQQPR